MQWTRSSLSVVIVGAMACPCPVGLLTTLLNRESTLPSSCAAQPAHSSAGIPGARVFRPPPCAAPRCFSNADQRAARQVDRHAVAAHLRASRFASRAVRDAL